MRTFKLKKQKDVNKFNVSWFWTDRTGISEDRVKGGQIIFYVETRREHLRCSQCGSIHVKKEGYVYRDYRGVPIGLKPVIIRMKVQRLYCEECGITRQEEIRIADKKKVTPMDSADMY